MTNWTETYRGAVPPWQCDVTEHFTVAYYFDRVEEAAAKSGRRTRPRRQAPRWWISPADRRKVRARVARRCLLPCRKRGDRDRRERVAPRPPLRRFVVAGNRDLVRRALGFVLWAAEPATTRRDRRASRGVGRPGIRTAARSRRDRGFPFRPRAAGLNPSISTPTANSHSVRSCIGSPMPPDRPVRRSATMTPTWKKTAAVSQPSNWACASRARCISMSHTWLRRALVILAIPRCA